LGMGFSGLTMYQKEMIIVILLASARKNCRLVVWSELNTV